MQLQARGGELVNMQTTSTCELHVATYNSSAFQGESALARSPLDGSWVWKIQILHPYVALINLKSHCKYTRPPNGTIRIGWMSSFTNIPEQDCAWDVRIHETRGILGFGTHCSRFLPISDSVPLAPPATPQIPASHSKRCLLSLVGSFISSLPTCFVSSHLVVLAMCPGPFCLRFEFSLCHCALVSLSCTTYGVYWSCSV
jgi:hypothetical protein